MAYYYVSSGVTSSGITLSGTGDAPDRMNISGGGAASNTTVNGGELMISSGGRAVNTTLNDGWAEVRSGGTMSKVTVNGGDLEILSGGTAVNVVWTPCVGEVDASADAVVTFASSYSGVYFGSNNQLLSHAGVMSGAVLGAPSAMYDVMSASMYVMSGGTAVDTTVDYCGEMKVRSGGTAVNTTFTGGRTDVVSGTMTKAAIDNGAVNIDAGTASDITINGGWMEVERRAVVTNITVDGGELDIYRNGVAVNVTVRSGGVTVKGSSLAANVTIDSGSLHVKTGGRISGVVIGSNGSMHVEDGTVTGKMTFEQGAVVTIGGTVDFDISSRTAGTAALLNDLSLVGGSPGFTLTVAANQTGGRYILAGGVSAFNRTITVKNTDDKVLGTITAGASLKVGDRTYTLLCSGNELSLTTSGAWGNAVGTSSMLSWDSAGDASYEVEFSNNGFKGVLRLETDACGVELYGLSAGSYVWHVKAVGKYESDWSNKNTFTAKRVSQPQLLAAAEDGVGDLFFGRTLTLWSGGFFAEHLGMRGVWEGTGERVALRGKNRITDIFLGSDDANLLVLTDDADGDALFLDDIYSAFPEAEQQARVARIDEIRAGAGDDIVDLTSQRFAYAGGDMTVRGGDGNDTIWANSGNNVLFGDAGDDRLIGSDGNDVIAGGIGDDSMHGGGGDDVFTFGTNWGNDTVEQLSAGSVTLWFKSGSDDNWNAETLTYTDGINSVTVSGVTADKVTLKFGAEEGYDALASLGAFTDATSEKIFGDTTKGLLA